MQNLSSFDTYRKFQNETVVANLNRNVRWIYQDLGRAIQKPWPLGQSYKRDKCFLL